MSGCWLEDAGRLRGFSDIRLMEISLFFISRQIFGYWYALHAFVHEIEGRRPVILRFGTIDTNLRHDADIEIKLQCFAHCRLEVGDLSHLRVVQIALYFLSAQLKAFSCLGS